MSEEKKVIPIPNNEVVSHFGIERFTELEISLRAQVERLEKEQRDYKELTRGNFNSIWNRLNMARSMIHSQQYKQAEEELGEVQEIADYCVRHGSTEQHRLLKDLREADASYSDLKHRLEECERALKDLKGENRKLKTALKPFADFDEERYGDHVTITDSNLTRRLDFGHCRAARKALEGK